MKNKKRSYAKWIWLIQNRDVHIEHIPKKHQDLNLCVLYLRVKNRTWPYSSSLLKRMPEGIRDQAEAIYLMEKK